MIKWLKVVCYKCGKQFAGEYREGSEVYCTKCHKWIKVDKDNEKK